MTAIGFVLLLFGVVWCKVDPTPVHSRLTPWQWAQVAVVTLGLALIVAGIAVFLWQAMP